MSSAAELDANLIEEEVRQTQDEIGATVQKLEDQLTPRQIARSVVGKDQADLVGEVIQLARLNPVPVALIAIGAIWLLSKSGSRATDLLARATGTAPVVDRSTPVQPAAAFSEATVAIDGTLR